MQRRAGAHLHDRRSDAAAVALRDQDSVNTDGLSRAQNGAEVTWILHAVKGHKQSWLSLENLLQGAQMGFGDLGDDILMAWRLGLAREGLQRFEEHANSPLSRLID